MTEQPYKQRRVSWDDAEIATLADKMANSLLKHPGMPLIQALDAAQSMMPPERRRKIQSVKKTAPDLYKAVCDRLAEIHAASKTAKPEPKEPEKIYVEQDPDEVFDEASPGELLMHFFRKVWAQMEHNTAKLDVIKQLLEQQQVAPAVLPGQVTKLRKLRIGVIGLYRNQFREVQAVCNGSAVLEFIDKDIRPFRIPSGLDHLILTRKFISHEHQTIAHNQYPRDRVHLVDGAQSNVIRKVNLITS